MHNDNEVLGRIVEAKRLEKHLSREKLAEKIGVGARHIFSIEHEGGNPSYKVLKKLIYALELSPDDIFYPQNVNVQSEIEDLYNMLRQCNKNQLAVIKATVNALLQNE